MTNSWKYRLLTLGCAAALAGCGTDEPAPDGISGSTTGPVDVVDDGDDDPVVDEDPTMDPDDPDLPDTDPPVVDPEPLEYVTTAIVVEANAEAGTSGYGLAKLRTGGELPAPEVTTRAVTEFGSGHVHVNASERGAFVMDSQHGIVRVVVNDDAEPRGTRVLADIKLQLQTDPEFHTRPQWVGDAGDSLVVSQFGTGNLMKVDFDWATGEAGPPLLVDLSLFDEEDGNPEPTIVLIDGDHAIVALQSLGPNYTVTKAAQILVWDIANEAVVAVHELPGSLFHAGMKWTPDGNVAAGLAGEIGPPDAPVLDGGIAILERNAPGDYSPRDAFLVSEEEFAGELWGFELVDERSGYAVVRTALGRELVWFEVGGPGEAATIVSVSGLATPSGWIELTDDAKYLWVADLGGETPAGAGMRVLDVETNGMLSHQRIGFDGRPTSFALTGYTTE